MRDVLSFKNIQDMSNEADEFLTKVVDPEIKACAKFLLLSCYSYINEFINEKSKKTYGNLSILINYEMSGAEKKDGKEVNGHSKLYNLMQQASKTTATRKIFDIYDNCEPQMKKYAQMRLMELLLVYYIK